MTISTIRRADAADYAAVEKAAERFNARHGITKAYDEQTAEEAVEFEAEHDARIKRLWQQCFCRALGEPYDRRLTIGYGYIGLSIR